MRTHEATISLEDQRLSEANALGPLLQVYRLKRWYIDVLYWCGSVLIVLSLLILVLVIIVGGFLYRSEVSLSSFLPPLLGSVCGLVFGLIGWYVVAPEVSSTRIIVCERGVAQVKRRIRKDLVEIVRWEDVVFISQGGLIRECLIRGRDGKTVTLDMIYQDQDALVAIIKQRSGVG